MVETAEAYAHVAMTRDTGLIYKPEYRFSPGNGNEVVLGVSHELCAAAFLPQDRRFLNTLCS